MGKGRYWPQTKPGWVAAGCRVFVQPPTVYVVAFDVHVVPVDGQDIYELQSNALAAAVAFTQTLGPGEPLFVARLIDALLQVQGMHNVHVFASGTGTTLSDVYAGETEVIRSAEGTVKVFPTLLT